MTEDLVCTCRPAESGIGFRFLDNHLHAGTAKTALPGIESTGSLCRPVCCRNSGDGCCEYLSFNRNRFLTQVHRPGNLTVAQEPGEELGITKLADIVGV